MAETAEDRIRRMRAEREARPTVAMLEPQTTEAIEDPSRPAGSLGAPPGRRPGGVWFDGTLDQPPRRRQPQSEAAIDGSFNPQADAPALGDRGEVSRTAPQKPAPRVVSVDRDPSAPAPAAPAAPTYRKITNGSGNFSTNGRFVGYDKDANVARIEKDNGSVIAVPIVGLSPADYAAAQEAPQMRATPAELARAADIRARTTAWEVSQANKPKTDIKSTYAYGMGPASAAAQNTPIPALAPAKPTPTGKPVDRRYAAGGPGGVASKEAGARPAVKDMTPPENPLPPRGPATTLPPDGYDRFTSTNGYTQDAIITGYSPSAGTVTLEKPDGTKVRVALDKLNEQSRKAVEARIGADTEIKAHNATADARRKEFEEVNGEGTFDQRFAPETAYPEHRGAGGINDARRLAARRQAQREVDGQAVVTDHNAQMARIRGGRSQVTPDQPADADPIPPRAREAAQAAVAPRGMTDQERFDANAQLRRQDTGNRLASGQGFANVEQQGALEVGGANQTVIANRDAAKAEQDARDKEVAKGRNQFERAQQGREWRERQEMLAALPPDERAALIRQENADKVYSQAFRDYSRNAVKNREAGVSFPMYLNGVLQQHNMQSPGVDNDLSTADVSNEAKNNRARYVANAETTQRREAASMNNRVGVAMSRGATTPGFEAAVRILRDPRAPQSDRNAAFVAISAMPGFDQRTALAMMNSENAVESQRIAADAESGAEAPKPRVDATVDDAVQAMPGADHDSVIHTAAGQIAAEQGIDDDRAMALATAAVVRRAWAAANAGSLGRVDESYLREAVIHGADPATGARQPKPLTEPEFVQRASRFGIAPDRASGIYRQLMRPPAPDSGRAPVGVSP